MKIRWYQRWWVVLLLALGLLSVGTWAWNVFQKHHVDAALAEEIAYLDQTDPHWRLEDWSKRHPPLAEEENLVLAVLQWKSKMVAAPAGDQEKVEQSIEEQPNQLLSAAQLATLQKMLINCKELTAEIQTMLKLKTGELAMPDLHSKQLRVHDLPSTQHQQLRTTADLLAFQVELLLHANQIDKAMQTTESILHLAQGLADERNNTGPSQVIGIQAKAVETVGRLLAMSEPSLASLESLQGKLLAAADRKLFPHFLRVMRADADRYVREISDDLYTTEELWQHKQIFSGSVQLTFIEELQLRLRKWIKSSPIVDIHHEHLQVLMLFKKIAERAATLPEASPQEMITLIRQATGQSAVCEEYGEVMKRLYAGTVMRRYMLQIAAALLASERYRLATGKVPTGWNDIVPAYFPSIPRDPYSGQAIRWKNTPTGFKLYSIWRNTVDDEGLIRDSSKGDRMDQGLEYFAPAHRRQPPVGVPPSGGVSLSATPSLPPEGGTPAKQHPEGGTTNKEGKP